MAVVSQSPAEYFKGLVDEAIVHQRVAAGELTSYYLVQLLAGFVRREGALQEALGIRLLRALNAAGSNRRASLKDVADSSLFVSGFFADSLRRRLVDLDYYVSLGGVAYHALSRNEADTFSPVFSELAQKFVSFAGVLAEVSEHSLCSTDADTLRLYESWLRTGSARAAKLLSKRRIVPNPIFRKMRVQ